MMRMMMGHAHARPVALVAKRIDALAKLAEKAIKRAAWAHIRAARLRVLLGVTHRHFHRNDGALHVIDDISEGGRSRRLSCLNGRALSNGRIGNKRQALKRQAADGRNGDRAEKRAAQFAGAKIRTIGKAHLNLLGDAGLSEAWSVDVVWRMKDRRLQRDGANMKIC